MRNKKFIGKYGSAYEGLKETDGKYIFHTLFFFYRRLLIIVFLIFYKSLMITQYLTVTLTGLGVVILLALREPFKSSFQNKAEIMDECAIMITMYHVFCFTQFIDNAVTKHYIGYSLMISIGIHLLVFLSAISFSSTRKALRTLKTAYYKRKRSKDVAKWRPGKTLPERRQMQEAVKIVEIEEQHSQEMNEISSELSSS